MTVRFMDGKSEVGMESTAPYGVTLLLGPNLMYER